MTLLGGAFLLGLMGGLHCLAMCGAFVVAVGGALSPAAAGCARPTVRQAGAALHVGRLLTYATLGAAAGGLGAAAGYVSGLQAAQSTLFFLANATLLAIAVYALRGTAGIPAFERMGARVSAAVQSGPLLGRLLRAQRLAAFRPVAIGVVWGFVPCGLVYSALALALFSGSALAGALVMAALWTGTLPSLAAAGWLLARIRARLGPMALQRAVGVVLLAFSLLGLYRLFFAPHSAALDAFCRLP